MKLKCKCCFCNKEDFSDGFILPKGWTWENIKYATKPGSATVVKMLCDKCNIVRNIIK
jgi:hypothetical protein